MTSLKPTPTATQIAKLAKLNSWTEQEASNRLWRTWKIENLALLQTRLSKIENGEGGIAELAFVVRLFIAILRYEA